MSAGVILIVLAGVSMGLYDVAQKGASKYLPPFVVSIISSFVVAALSLTIIFGARLKGEGTFNLTPRAILAAALVGIAATGIEIFGVWAYTKGLPVSTGSFITAGVPALTATALGLLLFGESLNLYKMFAMGLILVGTILLAKP